MKMIGKKFQSALVVLLGAVAAFAATPASADYYGSYPTRLTQYVGRQYDGVTRLPLRQLLSMGPEYRGHNVIAVTMTATTDFGRGEAQLLVNGSPVGYPVMIGTYPQEYSFYLDAYHNTVGVDFETLQIELRGRFNVQSVGAQLESVAYPAPRPPYTPYPPYPCPPTYPAPSRVSCTLYTVRGAFTGTSFNADMAKSDAFSECARFVRNDNVCRRGQYSCQRY